MGLRILVRVSVTLMCYVMWHISRGFATWRGIDLLALNDNMNIDTTMIRPALGTIYDCKASASVQDTSDHVRKVLDLPLPLRGHQCVHMGPNKTSLLENAPGDSYLIMRESGQGYRGKYWVKLLGRILGNSRS